MPDRERELERELRELGSYIEYPPTPDLARAVRRSLEQVGTARPPRSRRFWSSLPTLRWAVAAALLLIVAVPALSPTMRATVTGWFEAGQTATSGQPAGGARESPAAESPLGLAPSGKQQAEGAKPPADSAQKTPPLGENLGFDERMTLQEARVGSGEGKPLLLPQLPMLGDPDEVYAVKPPHEEGVALVYRTRPGLPPIDDTGVGLVLIELVGDVESAYFPEGAQSPTAVERVQVTGNPGYWIPTGHDLPSPIGRVGQLQGSILLWKQGGRTLLLEADIPKEEAIRIAESVH
jgi:Domain of unknown function (DUF4367)